MPASGFHYVYILRDVTTGQHHYTGVTKNLQKRLSYHNAGHVPHTSKYDPWHIETAISFRDKQKAYSYERYLKTGTGRVCATKHFWQRSSNAEISKMRVFPQASIIIGSV